MVSFLGDPNDEDEDKPAVIANTNHHGWTTLLEEGSVHAWMSSKNALDPEEHR